MMALTRRGTGLVRRAASEGRDAWRPRPGEHTGREAYGYRATDDDDDDNDANGDDDDDEDEVCDDCSDCDHRDHGDHRDDR